jgi:hypothetical protein
MNLFDSPFVEGEALSELITLAGLALVPICAAVAWFLGPWFRRALGADDDGVGPRSSEQPEKDLEALVSKLSEEQRGALRKLANSGQTPEVDHETARVLEVSLGAPASVANKSQEQPPTP